jgi:hypothetical protein
MNFALMGLLAFLPSASFIPRAEPPADEQQPPEAPIPAEVNLGIQGDEPEWIDSLDPKSVRPLIRCLEANEEIVQDAALQTLATMGDKALPAVPAIITLLRHPNGSVRLEAAKTLFHLNCGITQALRTLKEELKAGDTSQRIGAARVIGDLVAPEVEVLGSDCWGPGPPPSVPRPWLAKSVVPALIEALADKDARVRAAVAHNLGRIGRRATKALPALQRAQKDQDATVRQKAGQAVRLVEQY